MASKKKGGSSKGRNTGRATKGGEVSFPNAMAGINAVKKAMGKKGGKKKGGKK